MNSDQTRTVTLVVRYGLPFVILAFYLTAIRHFAYTPDSTFSGAIVVNNLAEWGDFQSLPNLDIRYSPNPLWVFFGVAGYHASIDLIVFAKVFAFFFCCAVLILAYLVAVEVLNDRLLAFCTTFVLAMQAWFIYLAPTGSAVSAASAFALGCIFFLLRNDYALAGLFAGLTSLFLWQASVLFVLVFADLVLNSVHRDRVVRIGSMSLLLCAATVVPWIVYALFKGIPIITGLLPLGAVPDFGFLATGSLALLIAMAAAGSVIPGHGDESWSSLRVQAGTLLWMVFLLVAAFSGTWELLPIAAPLVIIWAFRGIQRLLMAIHRERLLYAAAFGLAAVMLLLNQITFTTNVRPWMVANEESAGQRREIAAWVKSHVSDTLRIATDFPGELGYRTGNAPVGFAGKEPNKADIVISARREQPGYSIVFAPLAAGDSVTGMGVPVVWRRQH